jgi:hypothetical protein
MNDRGGPVRIDGWDEHLYWEIDFVGMKATRWAAQPDRDWTRQQFPIRRERGAWEIKLQGACSWRRFDDEVARQLEAMWRRFAAN